MGISHSRAIRVTLDIIYNLRNSGVGFANQPRLEKKIRLSNDVALIAAALFVGSVLTDYYAQVQLPLIMDAAVMILYLSVPLLNRFGYLLFSRFWLILLTYLTLYINVGVIGKEAGADYVCLAGATLPFILFDWEERTWLILSLVIAPLTFIATTLEDYSFIPQHLKINAPAPMFWYATASAFAFIYIVIFSFYRTNLRSERELHESKERYRIIAITAQDAILTLTDTFFVTFSNPAAERVFGYKESEWRNKSFLELFAPDEKTSLLLESLTAAKSKHLQENVYQTIGVRKDGVKVPLELTAGWSDKNGSSILTVVIRDISERKNAEAIIQRQQAQMFEASKLSTLGEIAGGIAHEINNPLAFISINNVHLKRMIGLSEYDRSSILDRVERIDRGVERISKIVNSLRYLARDASSDVLAKADIAHVVEETVTLCTERFKGQGIELSLSLPAEKVFAYCRSAQIAQALLNLLNNAYDAVLPCQKKQIDVSVTADREYIEIRVVDSGFGIAEHLRDTVFQPFFTTKEIGQGTGLGLSVAKGIIEAHQGDLHFNTTVDSTEFVIKLPRMNPVEIAI